MHNCYPTSSCQPLDEATVPRGDTWWERVPRITEAVPAGIFALMLWQSSRDIAPPRQDSEHHSIRHGLLDSLAHPHHHIVLVAALGFGCSVSSLAHRRQKEDPFQVPIVVLVVGLVATAAYCLGESSNSVLIGYVPPAIWASLVVSVCGHYAFRCLSRHRRQNREIVEKSGLLV